MHVGVGECKAPLHQGTTATGNKTKTHSLSFSKARILLIGSVAYDAILIFGKQLDHFCNNSRDISFD